VAGTETKLLAAGGGGPMKSVTWENVGIDRIGCAWLILKQIDRQADSLSCLGRRPAK
jgi:hypothetical protein